MPKFTLLIFRFVNSLFSFESIFLYRKAFCSNEDDISYPYKTPSYTNKGIIKFFILHLVVAHPK